MEILEKAYAKLNLSLDVVGRLPNGYHEMYMVMQSISLCDDVFISVTEGNGEISITTNRDYLPNDRRNIAYKAASVFMEKKNITGYDIAIRLEKRIPVCAGMGGGSTDGAAVLRGLNTLFNSHCTLAELQKMGALLGSDVPFSVAGGTAVATGTGTEIEGIPPLSDCAIVVCKPEFSVSTPELFSKIDGVKILVRPDTKGVISAIVNGDVRGMAMRMHNVFEEVLQTGRDTVNAAKGILYDNGALGACMTGTGSAVFGVFDEEKKAQSAVSALKAEYPEVFLCRPTPEIKIG